MRPRRMKPGLREAIFEHSAAKTLEKARHEWVWSGTWDAVDVQRCPCDQTIREVCEITNTVTGSRLEIGNKCVMHFDCEGAEEAALVAGSLRRIIKTPDASAAPALIQLGFDTKLLTLGDAEFLADTFGKKRLSRRQLELRFALNRKLVADFAHQRLLSFDKAVREIRDHI